jgi:MFS family permease
MDMEKSAYRIYVLVLLIVIYAINFLDRQIITIIAPYLKADLGITDAQLGLLFGTAFALFFAVFGLPLAKLADGWSRVKTIALGLSFWSLMTAVSGMAGSFVQLGLARIGVGVGEASASPASYSLLQDYFPKARRGTALALYSSGVYLGSGLALVAGGKIAEYWAANFTEATEPFGLAGWQATYLAFGIPGLFLALLLILTVREPVRGEIDGLPTPGHPKPFQAVLDEFKAMLPPWNWRGFNRLHPAGDAVWRNLLLMAALVGIAWVTIQFTDGLLKPEKRPIVFSVGRFGVTTNMVQWSAIAIGLYCSASWLQTIQLRDRPSFALLANRGVLALTLAGGFMSFISYGLSPFMFLYAKTRFGLGPEAGFTLGMTAAISGGLGASLGGVFADWLRQFHAAGRVYVMLIAALGSTVTLLLAYFASSPAGYFTYTGLNIFIHIMWLGPCAATIQDLVLPRMRGTGAATLFLGTSIIGLGLGPYIVGLISDVTGDLRYAMLCTLFVMPPAIAAIVVAIRDVPRLEEKLIDRARAAGEAV